jgi:hypothetical protein
MEDTLNGMYSYINTNLEAGLVAIETARSVTIPRWKKLQTGFVLTKQYPNISIVPVATAFEYGEQDEFLNPWYDHTISIIIQHSGGEQKTIQTDLVRYVEALTELFVGSKNNYQAGGLFEVVQLSEVNYSLIEAHEDRSIIQATDMEILVREVET